jgi:CheY-like chemotaxis protein/HPt (histidine-containing phosphotransfer) domain-containing protein
MARKEDANLVSVYGNTLTRSDLINAVAIAAGRAQEVTDQVNSLVGSNATKMPSSSETKRRKGSRILVAEDNDINQNVILHQLGLLGYIADLAVDGREALAFWHQGNYALLLTDLHMPEMDGYDLTAAIRKSEEAGTHLPILALTANAVKREEMHCKEVGMDDYLSKPVLLSHLQSMLEKWLPVPGPHDYEIEGEVSALSESNHLALLDMAVLPGLVGNDPALIAEFFADYRHSAQKSAEEIHAAFALKDWKAAGDVAHKLKSSSRSVGALALGDVCARLELAGKAINADAALALAPEFESALVELMVAISQEGY